MAAKNEVPHPKDASNSQPVALFDYFEKPHRLKRKNFACHF